MLKQNISNYLINLGYPKEVFSEYLMDVHVSDDGNLEKDYNMLMRKYSKKYSGDKLKYFIKGKNSRIKSLLDNNQSHNNMAKQ